MKIEIKARAKLKMRVDLITKTKSKIHIKLTLLTNFFCLFKFDNLDYTDPKKAKLNAKLLKKFFFECYFIDFNKAFS